MRAWFQKEITIPLFVYHLMVVVMVLSLVGDILSMGWRLGWW
jgi:hypothetical protein